MEASQAVPQVEKRLYQNNTSGWLGVVTIDHQGKDMGAVVEPNGTIWLSDAEAILTARAPKDAKDNPFEEQEFIGLDENGARKAFKMRPLTLLSDESRFVPSNDRFVPIFEEEGRIAATVAAHGEQPGAITGAAAARSADVVAHDTVPVVPVSEPAPSEPLPAPSSAPLEGETPTEESDDTQPSWTEPSPQAGQVVPGSLQGSDEGPAEGAADAPAPAATSAPVPAQAVPTAPGGQEEPDEEHAQAVDPAIGEETGQAKQPTGDAPEGEFAQAEEVGSPDAPAAGAPAGD